MKIKKVIIKILNEIAKRLSYKKRSEELGKETESDLKTILGYERYERWADFVERNEEDVMYFRVLLERPEMKNYTLLELLEVLVEEKILEAKMTQEKKIRDKLEEDERKSDEAYTKSMMG